MRLEDYAKQQGKWKTWGLEIISEDGVSIGSAKTSSLANYIVALNNSFLGMFNTMLELKKKLSDRTAMTMETGFDS